MEIDYFKYVDNFSKYKNVKSEAIIEGKIRNPKITIAIPTYKRNHLIKNALDSALNQKDFDNYEVIIVDNDDDFNNKELENILKKYNNEKISYYKNEKNIGMFGNWNRCIELAKGEYISILNDDDWLELNFLSEVSKYIDGKRGIYTETIINDLRETKPIVIESNLKKIVKNLYNSVKSIKKTRKLKIMDFFYWNRSFGSLGILFNKDAMIDLGGYNEDFFPSTDYFFHVNYCLKYKILLLKKKLCNYRIEENESMKKSTAILWIEQGKNFRNFLIKEYLKNKKYIKENKIITECFKKSLNFWNILIDYDNKIVDNKKIIMKIKLREYLKNILG